MAINFNIEPYYDDFDDTKNYHRILFRPGYAVQARELTQLQTQLQDQIKKFGNHIFVNGTVVIGGGRSFENNLLSIKLNSSFSGATVNINNFAGKIITGSTSGTKAVVKSIADITTADPKTLLVKIISGSAFTAGENIVTSPGTAYTATIQSSSPFNTGMSFAIDSGVYYIDGKFVFVEAQSIPISKYSNTSSHNIGFVIEEDTISSDEDSSILDRAQGTPNFAAPGADRYKAALTLTVKNLGSALDDFVEIARVVSGELVINENKTIYSEIGKELARRTFDESGDYTVKKWPIQILDHQATSPDATKFTVALDPGKAYIKGYEFETINQEFLTLDRARDTDQADNLDVNVTYGNYIVVTSLFGQFTTNAASSPYSSVEIHDVVRGSVSSSSSKIGSAKVRFLTLNSGTPGTSATYKMYLFDIVIDAGKFLKNAESIVILSGSSVLSGANVDVLSKVGGSGSGDAFLSGQDSPGLVFPLLNQYVKTVRDALNTTQSDYTIQRTFSSVAFSAGTASISTANGLERFVGTSGALSDTIKDQSYHAVITAITNAGSTGLSVGSIIRFNTSASRSISLTVPSSGVAHQATFNINDASFAATVTIIAGINANTQTERVKTLSSYTIKILGTGSGGGLNTTLGGKDSLALSDIYEVAGVYNTGTTNPTAVTINGTTGALTWGAVSYTDVTDNYIVDNGQRAEYYDHGNLVLSGTAPTSSHYLLVVYRNFSHSGNGFLSVDSYGIDYTDIPQFTDPSTGTVYELKDSIDFRPRRADGGSTLSGGQVPDPDGTFNCDYQYYLGRFDKVIATSDGQFIVKQGVPAVYPVVPVDESNGMTIYIVAIPPYTSYVSDIQIKYQDNKRYTMRDIGRLEKRISNLEYYTQLSLLEKQAKDTSIPDASNFEKFKNGFAVDPFTSQDIFYSSAAAWSERRWGWWNAWFNGSNTWSQASTNYNENSIANAADPGFNAAVDPLNQELRASFVVNFHKFDVGTLTDTERNGDLVTLSYTEEDVIVQNLATTYVNVNPFNVVRFLGSIVLEPSFDQWVDTEYLPAVNRVVDVQVPDAADLVIQNFSGGGNRVSITGRNTTINTNVIGTSTTSLGTSVVDIQYIPFMRANTVLGVCKTFKPNAELYPFIENTDISSYIKPLTLVQVQNFTTRLNTDQGAYEELSFKTGSASGVEAGTARAAIFTQPLTTDATKRLLTIFDEDVRATSTTNSASSGSTALTATTATGTIRVGMVVSGSANIPAGTTVSAVVGTAVTLSAATTGAVSNASLIFNGLVVGKYVVGSDGGSGVITAVTTYSLGDALIPDEYGNIGFEFQIPANTFKTGERTIRLIDNSTNDTEAQESIGESKYTAIGTLQTKQETLLTTRAIQNQRVTVETGTRFWVDPTAQSFLVDPNAYSQGFYLSSVDVFFRTKSSTIPVTMEIRRTVNGYPESNRTIPFAEVVLHPEDVSTSTTGNTATTFNFANPIHLSPGEYAIVLLTNSDEYQVYVSEIGETVLGGTAKVDKQPYLGSLFKSQNASTWEADQNKDLKFVMRRAEFEASGTAEFSIIDPAATADYQTLFTNSSTILPTGTTIVWEAKAYNADATFDAEWAPININQDINYSFLRRLAVASGIGGTPSLRLRATLATSNTAVSPAVDAAALSVVTALNTINNDSTNESGLNTNGNALARYITNPINLADGFDASNLCVTVDINRPSGTDVKIYYKTLPTEKTTPISDELWYEMTLESAVSSSVNNFDFREHRYFPSGAFDAYGVPQDGPITTRFNTFQIKIVMLSTSAANTPRLRDLRIIALDS
jgi:hypothetical protein